MSRWVKRYKYTVNYGLYTFEYDTAYEFGVMVAESKCGMPNPYEPDFKEYEDFNKGRWSVNPNIGDDL